MIELREGVDPSWVAVLFAHISRLDGVDSVCDLAVMPLEFLEDRILLRLDPNDIPKEYRSRKTAGKSLREHARRKRQPALFES